VKEVGKTVEVIGIGHHGVCPEEEDHCCRLDEIEDDQRQLSPLCRLMASYDPDRAEDSAGDPFCIALLVNDPDCSCHHLHGITKLFNRIVVANTASGT
jgi:hypothetical protein